MLSEIENSIKVTNEKIKSVKKFKKTEEGFKKKLRYMKKNYQLYFFFMLPPLLLLIIFKYIPIGGILMAFEDYSPIQGLLGREWVGFKHFSRFISSPDFMNLLMNTLKLSVFGLLWGFPIPIILAILISRVKSERLRKNIQLII